MDNMTGAEKERDQKFDICTSYCIYLLISDLLADTDFI